MKWLRVCLLAQAQGDDSPLPPTDHLEGWKSLADALEEEFAQPALQKQLNTIKDKAAAIGKDNWPQALWTMPDAESRPVWDAMRVRKCQTACPVECLVLNRLRG